MAWNISEEDRARRSENMRRIREQPGFAERWYSARWGNPSRKAAQARYMKGMRARQTEEKNNPDNA